MIVEATSVGIGAPSDDARSIAPMHAVRSATLRIVHSGWIVCSACGKWPPVVVEPTHVRARKAERVERGLEDARRRHRIVLADEHHAALQLIALGRRRARVLARHLRHHRRYRALELLAIIFCSRSV